MLPTARHDLTQNVQITTGSLFSLPLLKRSHYLGNIAAPTIVQRSSTMEYRFSDRKTWRDQIGQWRLYSANCRASLEVLELVSNALIMGFNPSTYFALTISQEKYLFWLESTKALRLESLEMGCGDLLVTKPNFKEMSRAELRKYIVQTHDEDAFTNYLSIGAILMPKSTPTSRLKKSLEKFLNRRLQSLSQNIESRHLL